MSVDVAVIIVTYNSAHVIEDLLESIPGALGDLTADVVVVDNGSTDGTLAIIRERVDCRTVLSTNVGYAGGINRGVSEADPADTILVLNPDMRLHPDSIRKLMECLSDRTVGIVAPRVLRTDGSLFYSLRREPSLGRTLGLSRTRMSVFSEQLNNPDDYSVGRVVDWALGAVLAISRECFVAVGGWDESYFLYSEETDFCLQAARHGFATRYEPAAVTTHIGGQSGQTSVTQVMQAVNRVRLYRRHHGRLKSSIFYGLTAVNELRRAGRGGARHLAAVKALLNPARRPSELGCSDRIIPL